MAEYRVIADVTASLADFLGEGIREGAPAPPVLVHDLQGKIPTTPATLTLFLYEVTEDEGLIRDEGTPAPLVLRYLVTPWSGTFGTDQELLGRVLQLFHEHSRLQGPHLHGRLAEGSVALELSARLLTAAELERIWRLVSRPYRLSMACEARVTPLERLD